MHYLSFFEYFKVMYYYFVVNKKKATRFEQIRDILADGHFATKKELAGLLALSVTTIQRDLIEMEKDGIVVRMHGGVIASTDVATYPIASRKCNHYKEKEKIGQKAASLILPNDILFIETGTTCVSFFEQLNSINVTIFTNSIAIAISDKMDRYYSSVFLLPGMIHNKNLAVYGYQTLESMEKMNANKFVFSCVGMNIEGKILCANEFDRSMINSICKKKKLKILLIDSSKFETEGAFTAASIDDIDIVVTDDKIPNEFRNMIEKDHKKTLIIS